MTILHLLAFVSVLTHTVKPSCRDERSGISTFPVMFPLLQISVRQMRRETIEWWGGGIKRLWNFCQNSVFCGTAEIFLKVWGVDLSM